MTMDPSHASTGTAVLDHSLTALDLELTWSSTTPVTLVRVIGAPLLQRSAVPLVSVFTTTEQRERSSQSYLRSAVGERLRYRRHWVRTAAASRQLHLEQHDPRTGLVVRTVIERPTGQTAYRFAHRLINDGAETLSLTAVTSMTLGLGSTPADADDFDVTWGASEWLAEGRWRQEPVRAVLPYLNLALHGQDARGRWSCTSQGGWSTGSSLPCGVLSGPDGSVAWQVETSGAWHVELSQTATNVALIAAGPGAEHSFVVDLLPGGEFDTVPAAACFTSGSRDEGFGALTRYRRWLRRQTHSVLDQLEYLPVVYNDFMNTLMGDPSTEKLEPLIRAAADAGAEYFCIDAGWFADPDGGDWWSSVGEWREAPKRFTGGLKSVIELIHRSGMRSGLWLEPEVIGVDSPMSLALPDEAFFHRRGVRVREANRYHLDFRHPAARAHLDATVDHLVETYGIGFLKLDYNIDPGEGTDILAGSPTLGLLGHTRAYRQWLVDVKRRHPHLLIENCASGAMRMDYALLSATDLQSTTDQQDYRLYPPIAVSAPASIVPEQCGNWAYPAAAMTDEQTAFSMVAGIVGRLYLSGFLDQLRPSQTQLVRDAVQVHQAIRDQIAVSLPAWPLGLPSWDDDILVLSLDSGIDRLLAIWFRASEATTVVIPGRLTNCREIYPVRDDLARWTARGGADGLTVQIPAGPSARLFRLSSAPGSVSNQ